MLLSVLTNDTCKPPLLENKFCSRYIYRRMFGLTGYREDDLLKYTNVTLCKYQISGVNLTL